MKGPTSSARAWNLEKVPRRPAKRQTEALAAARRHDADKSVQANLGRALFKSTVGANCYLEATRYFAGSTSNTSQYTDLGGTGNGFVDGNVTVSLKHAATGLA